MYWDLVPECQPFALKLVVDVARLAAVARVESRPRPRSYPLPRQTDARPILAFRRATHTSLPGRCDHNQHNSVHQHSAQVTRDGLANRHPKSRLVLSPGKRKVEDMHLMLCLARLCFGRVLCFACFVRTWNCEICAGLANTVWKSNTGLSPINLRRCHTPAGW